MTVIHGRALLPLCSCLCLFVAAGSGHADPQRDRIAAERAAANAKFTEKENACRAHFIVAPCVDAARKEQSATLERLHREELESDETKRRDAAAAREHELADKAAAQQARASDARAELRHDKGREPSRPNAPLAGRSGDQASKLHSSATAEDRRAREERSEQQFEARARAAQAHRESVAQRNAQRAAQGKVAAPLPAPAGASAP